MDRRAFLALPLAARAASTALYSRLHATIEKLEIIDTHEHYRAESLRLKENADFFSLVGHYTIDDLVSAGMSRAETELLANSEAPAERKWAAFEPAWKQARNTGYGQALRIAIRDIYGFDDISAGTLPKINAAIAAENKPGLYHRLIRVKSGISYVVNDAVVHDEDAKLLRASRRFDHVLAPTDLKAVEKWTGVSVSSIADLKRALATHVEHATHQGMVAMKCALAYSRNLTFTEVSEGDAARDFEAFLAGRVKQPGRAAVDHMVHHLLQLADQFRVPVQIHTGMLAGNGHHVEQTRPTQLANLFLKFPRVRFDIFHAGYPYYHEFSVLVKQFPNVFGNFCWTHIISPAAARQILREMLDSVPANKILGFGGDYRYPELSYGHLVIARRNIAAVLAERVEAGIENEDQAVQLARWMLHDNAARLFSPARA
jgi:predicted TIM-barrel fold metal-dependent hydrolase